MARCWEKFKKAWSSPVRYGGGGIGVSLASVKLDCQEINAKLLAMGKRKKRVKYGVSAYGCHKVTIFKSYVNSGLDGVMYENRLGYCIEIHHTVFDDPILLDESLMHEFVHVVEAVHGLDWRHTKSGHNESCCPAVKALGHGLAQLFREFRQST